MRTSSDRTTPSAGHAVASWKSLLIDYQVPSTKRAVWQIINTLVPYALLWYLMYLAAPALPWLLFPLSIVAGAFLVRVFIIFHDCGHGSFVGSRVGNEIIGFLAGILTFTPFHHWRWQHAVHHSSAGDLNRRGTGDVWTMTVQEYLEASRWRKVAYRFVRNPIILFMVAPLYLFLVQQRFPAPNCNRRELHSVYAMNVALAGMIVGLVWVFGLKAYLIIQLGILISSGAAGVWLFYVQHQFEGVYWERGNNWSFTEAALRGSSFYKLPTILQWFSGNIGFHHIHHLSPRIPNYNLERCHQSHSLFQEVPPVTLLSSLKSITFRFWDEKGRQLVGYRDLAALRFRSEN